MVARAPIDRATRELIAELGKGEHLDPGLRTHARRSARRGREPRSAGDAVHSVAEWMSATPEERGAALVDLLLLADALPHGGRVGKPLEFPPSTHRQSGEAPSGTHEPSLPDKVIAVHEALRKAKLPHAIGGALALAYYAEPRATIDIDLNVFVSPERWEDVVGALGAARHRRREARLRRPPARRAVPALVGSEPGRPLLLERPDPRGDAQAGQAPALRRRRPSPSWHQSISPSSRRCSPGPRTGSTSSRCCSRPTISMSPRSSSGSSGMVGKDDPRLKRLTELKPS